MYRAHFKYEEKEPLKMYFTAEKKTPVKMEFEAPQRKTIVLRVSENKSLEVG